MKIIEFNVGALAEESKSFESCINLMEQVHQEMSIAISELSVSHHSDVLANKNELIRIQRDAAALKTTISNLKNVLSYAGDLYWNTELDYQKRINGEWEVVDKPFYESKGFKFVAGAAIAIGTGVACVVFSVPAIVVGIGVAVGVGVCAFTVYTAHKIGTELDAALADGVFKGTKETALLIGTGVFAGKVVQLGMKASLIQNVGTKLSQISAINNAFFKCLALDKMEDMIADGADDLLRGDSVSISLINPLIKEVAKGNLALTPGKAIGLFQLALTGKRSQLDNVDFAPTSNQLDHVLDEGLDIGDLNRLDEALDVNLNQVDDGVEGAGKLPNMNNINDFKDGLKSFDEVAEDYAKLYAQKVNANTTWSWNKSMSGAENLTVAQKKIIKEKATASGLIPDVKIRSVDGMKYGFADFSSAGVVDETLDLPKELWLKSDSEQFDWLNNQVGGKRESMTWHHTEIPGKMELVPFGIHNITNHNGGRTIGMWAFAPR